MEKLKHTLFRSWYTLETMEDRIYHIILDVAVFMSFPTVVLGFVLKMPRASILVSVAILVFLIILQFITMRYPKYSNVCRLLMVLGMNLVLMPFCFFSSGGLHSGMVLFFLTGFVLCGLLLRGKVGGTVFAVSMLVMLITVALSVRFPEWVAPMTPEQHMIDTETSLIITGISVYAVTTLLMRTYAQERQRNIELMEKLRELSAVDALSGLYNRRELFRRLDVMYDDTLKERTETLDRKNSYIAMFDLDNFKNLNDTYGHGFGDTVLVSVSNVLQNMVNPKNGEISARYGGEEFVSILSAKTLEEAYARVDKARDEIQALRWADHPHVCVSISGGLISCENHPDLTQALHDVDELLYKAKASGKNRICYDE